MASARPDSGDRPSSTEQRASLPSPNIRAAEEILMRYIQQRKKKLAELALLTLLELDPEHPRKEEYSIWIEDLDQEAAIQNRLDRELAQGRAALAAQSVEEAKAHLDNLRKLDPYASVTDILAAEVGRHERLEVRGAEAERLKEEVEGLIETGMLSDAEDRLEKLAGLDLPKVTLDVLRKRLETARLRLRDEARLQALEDRFDELLGTRQWDAARDAAHEVGRLFPLSERPGEMFAQVSQQERKEQHLQSVEQGVATCEQLIARGRRQEALLALKVLKGLNLDAARLDSLEQRVAKLPE